MNIHKTFEEVFNDLNMTHKDIYNFRRLEENDYNKGYFELLSQLTVAVKPDYQNWNNRFSLIEKSNLSKIFVVESLNDKKIIASITCLIELKFIRNLGSVCHIEDVVIDSEHRNKKLGSKLINLAFEFAKKESCYKIILDSKEEVTPFYEKMGFKRSSNCLTIYL